MHVFLPSCVLSWVFELGNKSGGFKFKAVLLGRTWWESIRDLHGQLCFGEELIGHVFV